MWRVDIEVPNGLIDKSSPNPSACYPRRSFVRWARVFPHRTPGSIWPTCVSDWPVSLPVRQALPFYSTTDFRPVWAYLRTPPLLFRRPPPQWNYPASRFFNILIRKKNKREWYSNVKHAFPPMLYTFLSFPLETYSKAARGLTVLLLVLRIFTENSISLSSS